MLTGQTGCKITKHPRVRTWAEKAPKGNVVESVRRLVALMEDWRTPMEGERFPAQATIVCRRMPPCIQQTKKRQCCKTSAFYSLKHTSTKGTRGL